MSITRLQKITGYWDDLSSVNKILGLNVDQINGINIEDDQLRMNCIVTVFGNCFITCKIDHIKGREYFEKAYKLGDPESLFYLGILYENGIGVNESFDKAREYYEKGSEQGDISSIRALANLNSKCYESLKVFECNEKGASIGDTLSLVNLD